MDLDNAAMLERTKVTTRMKQSYFVAAIWDAETSVWCSESDIPGLVIEADTLADFEQLMNELAPEMLAANEDDGGSGAIELIWQQLPTTIMLQ